MREGRSLRQLLREVPPAQMSDAELADLLDWLRPTMHDEPRVREIQREAAKRIRRRTGEH